MSAWVIADGGKERQGAPQQANRNASQYCHVLVLGFGVEAQV